jgi:Na+/H+-translocating membrane pyrophosphatase
MVPGRELSGMQAIAGGLATSLASWIVILSVGFAVFRAPIPAGPLCNLSLAVEEAAKMVIRRLLKITLPLFVSLGAVFLLGLTWQFCTSLVFTGIVTTCASAFVLRVASASHARCALATQASKLRGFETALHSGMIVGIASVAPVLLWIVVLTLAFDYNQLSFIACGFGVTLVNLVLHIGGVIFSKGSQLANEKRAAAVSATRTFSTATTTSGTTAAASLAALSLHRAHCADASGGATPVVDEESMAPDHSPSVVVVDARRASSQSLHTPQPCDEGPTALRILELTGATVDDAMGVSLDLVNSLVIAMVACMIVGTELYGSDGVSLPLWLVAAGLASCLIALAFTALIVNLCGERASHGKVVWLMRAGYCATTVLFLSLSSAATSILHFDSEVCS